MIADILNKALKLDFLSREEAIAIYNAPLADLIWSANEMRKALHPDNTVGWIIDRNVNITNVCISQCKFCNFCRKKSDSDTYITSFREYETKVIEMKRLGGNQLLLQGGMHPDLGIDFYEDLFSGLKKRFPEVRLHALGPPEIAYLAKKESLEYAEVLKRLTIAGLDSLPGAGAEILSDRVRKVVSPAKCSAREWLDVMKEAHKLNILTSATMMFGHAETTEERIDHILSIRDLQSIKPEGSIGFISFIPWPFQDYDTVLRQKLNIRSNVSAGDYIRVIALSRLLLPNVKNIQASWLTVGKDIGQICLNAGANDFGSIMIEENVVSSAGATNTMNAEAMQNAIRDAGFIPRLRNQRFETLVQ